MANTYYLPSESGWASGNYKARLKVVQTYNSSTNQSSITVTPQFSAVYEYGSYGILSGSFQFSSGSSSTKTTMWDFSQRASGNLIPYRAPYGSGQAWRDMTVASGLSTSTWPTSYTRTFSHNLDGTLSLTFYASSVLTNSGSANATFTGQSTKSFPGTARTYTLTITKDAHAVVTVKDGSTILPSGSTITYGHTLTVTAAAANGYQIKTFIINGASKTSPASVIVTGNVTVAVTTEALGFAYLRTGSAWSPYLIYLYVSGAWQRYRAYIYTSGAWRPY